MDRVDHFNTLINEANTVPEKFDISHIKKRVKRRYRVRQFGIGARNIAAVFVLLLVVVGIGVNTSTAFANEVGKIPVLKNIAKILDFSEEEKLKDTIVSAPDLEETFDYLTLVDETVASEQFGFNGTIQYAFADEFGLCVYYKIDKPVDNIIVLDTAVVTDKTTGNKVDLVCVDSFGVLRSDGYNLFRFYWNEFHENVELEMLFKGYPEYNSLADSEDTLTYNISGLTKIDGFKLSPDYRIKKDDFEIYVNGVDIYPSGTVAHVGAKSDRKLLDRKIVVDIFDEHGTYAESIMSGLTTYYSTDNFDEYSQVFQSGYFKFDGNIYVNVKEYSVALEKSCFKYNLITHDATLDDKQVEILTICNKNCYDIARGYEGEIKNNIYVDNEEEIGLSKLHEGAYYIAIPKELGFSIDYQNYDKYSYAADVSTITKDWEYNGKLYDVIEVADFMINEDDCVSYSSADVYSETLSENLVIIKEDYKAKYKESNLD